MTTMSDYIVEPGGLVFSKISNRYLKIIIDKDGYHTVKVAGKLRKVHRLVAEAFIPNPDNLPEVNHKDFNRANNHRDNLEWVSRAHNLEHSRERQISSAVRTYTFIDPQGNVVSITNLSQFCKERDLNMNSMNKVHSGWRTFKSHKGWRRYVE